MRKFHAYKWNERDRDYLMRILTEEDIENRVEWRGAGIDILVLPSKYQDMSNEYLDFIRITVLTRSGEIIYV